MAKRTVHPKRIDGNQVSIVTAMRAAGSMVLITASVGMGVPDCFATNRAGRWIAIEIKVPGAGLTSDEAELHEQAAAHDCPICIVRTVDEAIALVTGDLE